MWIGVTGVLAVLSFGMTWGVTQGKKSSEDIDQRETAPVDVILVPFDPPQLSGPPRSAGGWGWVELRGGECLETPLKPDTSQVTVVDCVESHRAVYLSPILASDNPDAPYPGEGAIAARALEHCSGITPSGVNGGPEVEDLVVAGVYPPDEESWQRGERVVACVVYREGGDFLPTAATVSRD